MDTPGHVNFSDEQTAALRISDGAVIFIDVVEGVMKQTIRSIKHSIENGVPIVVVMTKMDRLILELKLPPKDSYHKLFGIFKEINDLLTNLKYPAQISPERGNVCFSSALFGWSFTLDSLSRKYQDRNGLLQFFDNLF
ncbi:hypothetical protein MHBO_003798 [Bonamia ostreae]|uniref:Tr-type G domain-containing protein n=1 Tax=Bonamia ostreae TaxID=126728 RepID=A0ABV2AS22_9EUKA